MRFEPGVVDGRPAILARERPDGRPVYCLFVRFRSERIQFIRDYRYARYVFDKRSGVPRPKAGRVDELAGGRAWRDRTLSG
jgi:hypothetical protein